LFTRVEVGSGFRQGPSAPQAAHTDRAQEKAACSGRDDSGEKSEGRSPLARSPGSSPACGRQAAAT